MRSKGVELFALNEKTKTKFLLATEGQVQIEFNGLASGHHETLAVMGWLSFSHCQDAF